MSVITDDVAGSYGDGVSDIDTSTPISTNTVFRIGSITKTITAIAVTQLWEGGLIDLDAPPESYLGAYRRDGYPAGQSG
ncbi:MAG: serine hydrolase domain-containing protein [Acidimicrobiia bacterium]